MEIYFYKTSSDHKQINKSLTDELLMDVHINNDMNIYNLNILIERDTDFTHNYCFIPSLNRYYYITNIEYSGANLWNLALICDVLMTYKNDILSSVATLNKGDMASMRYFNTSDIPYDVRKVDIVNKFNNPFNEGINIIIGVAGKSPTA